MRSARALAFAAIGALGLIALGCSKKAPPPPPVEADAAAVDTRAVADKSIEANCGVCHTLDMLRSQRLTRAQWEKEFKKMTGWGAQVALDETGPVIDRLFEQQGTDSPAFAFATITAADVRGTLTTDPTPAAGDVARGEMMYTATCQGCHGPQGKGAVGPNLVERPVIFRGAEFAHVVRDGRQKMPPFGATLDQRAIDDLRAYLQSRHD